MPNNPPKRERKLKRGKEKRGKVRGQGGKTADPVGRKASVVKEGMFALEGGKEAHEGLSTWEDKNSERGYLKSSYKRRSLKRSSLGSVG